MKSNAWIKSKASGTIWIPQVRCFAIPTHLMVTTLATQAPGNKNNTLRKSLQTTSASPYRTQVQLAASFLVCSLIFIEYKKSFSLKEEAFYLFFCCFLICPKAFFVLK